MNARIGEPFERVGELPLVARRRCELIFRDGRQAVAVADPGDDEAFVRKGCGIVDADHARVELGTGQASGEGDREALAKPGAEFGFDALGMGLGRVEHHARRAAAGVGGDLQVLDVVIEGRGVEGDRAAAELEAGLVVPQGLVVVGRTVAEGLRDDPGRSAFAQRNVQRVVDSAEAEALRSLEVDAEIAVGLPGDDRARGEAVRLGLVADEHVAVGKDAARDEVAAFLEAVVAAAGGQLDLAKVVGGLAEDRALLDVVGDVGVVRRVPGEAVAQVDGVHRSPDRVQEQIGEDVRSGGWKPLGIFAVDLGIEATEDPLERPAAGGAEAKFLRPLLEIGRIAKVRRETRAGCDRRVGARERNIDGAGQGRCVAADQDVAIDVAGDAGQFDAAKADASDQVGEQGLVGKLLTKRQILLAPFELFGPGGELVGVEIVAVLAVEAVGLDLLIGDAGSDLDIGGRLPQERDPGAEARSVVDVLARGRADGVDEAAIFGAVADHPERGGIAQRQVDRALQMIAKVAFLDRVDVGLDHAFGHAELGLIGDVTDGPADAARSEQSALRTTKCLDAIEVEQVEVGSEQRKRDDAFVEVDADLFLDARLVTNDLAGRDTADRNLALARPEILNGQTRDIAADVLDRLRVAALNVCLRLGVDREWDVLDRRSPLGRGDDDFRRIVIASRGLGSVGIGGLRLTLRSGLGKAR